MLNRRVPQMPMTIPPIDPASQAARRRTARVVAPAGVAVLVAVVAGVLLRAEAGAVRAGLAQGGAASAGSAPSGSAPTGSAPDAAVPVRQDGPAPMRVVTLPSGEKVVELTWPIGHVETLRTLRIPWGYRSLLPGGTSSAPFPGAPDVARQQGYPEVFGFSARMPGLTAHDNTDLRALLADRHGERLQALVHPGVSRQRPVWDERRNFRIYPDAYLAMLQREATRLRTGLIEKPGRHGLRRIGPERFAPLPSEIGTPYSDMWFDGPTPEESTSVIVCGADERNDGSPDPANGPMRLCEHFITSQAITASVKLAYRKMHLPQWREIAARVEELLESFVVRD
jgi:hypothetical protein